MSSAPAACNAGESLSAIIDDFRRRLGIAARLLPMSDDPVRTRLRTEDGLARLPGLFRAAALRAGRSRELAFAGAETARPHPDFLAALADPELRAVVICPSNPFISIDPILAVPGVRDALRDCRAPVVAVSPIVAGQAVKGPTAKMMAELGLPVDAATPARHYRDFLDLYIADEADAAAVAGSRHPGRADPHPDAEPRRPRGAGPHRPRRRRPRPQMSRAADIWAVVPVKDTAAAKQRLAPALPPDLRQGLALAMLEDVLAALAEARGLAGRVLVTIDPAATRLAARYGARVLDRRRRATAIPARSSAAARRLAAEGRGGDADPARRHPARHRRRDRAPDRRAPAGARPSRSRRRMTRWARTRSSCRRPMR